MAINKTYEELVESAKPKLTTDDCYTPENIYNVVRDYVAERYGLDPGTFVRPFYPGGDYQAEDYTGKVVVDNPPFSKKDKIFLEYLVFFVLYRQIICLYLRLLIRQLLFILIILYLKNLSQLLSIYSLPYSFLRDVKASLGVGNGSIYISPEINTAVSDGTYANIVNIAFKGFKIVFDTMDCC